MVVSQCTQRRVSGLAPHSAPWLSPLNVRGGGVYRWEDALGVWARMQEEGVAGTTVTYSALVAVCAKAARWEEALRLVACMREEGVERNTITFNSLISACGRAARLDQALAARATMQAVRDPSSWSWNARLPFPVGVREWSCLVVFQSRPVSRLRYTQLGVWARLLTRGLRSRIW